MIDEYVTLCIVFVVFGPLPQSYFHIDIDFDNVLCFGQIRKSNYGRNLNKKQGLVKKFDRTGYVFYVAHVPIQYIVKWCTQNVSVEFRKSTAYAIYFRNLGWIASCKCSHKTTVNHTDYRNFIRKHIKN